MIAQLMVSDLISTSYVRSCEIIYKQERYHPGDVENENPATIMILAAKMIPKVRTHNGESYMGEIDRFEKNGDMREGCIRCSWFL